MHACLRAPLLTAAFLMAAHAATPDCAALAKDSIPNTVIRSEVNTEKTFTPPDAKPLANLPAFCRVQMTLTPTSDSDIKVEIWLPLENWNGKLQGIGNGGFAGSIGYNGLAEALQHNYAAVATDTGHQGGAEDASWALNHPEKIADFGYRAIHLMTDDARHIVQTFYGTPAKHAYFNSCSDGGREALMEAQRFPTDYDGIVAGAPANYWTHLVSNAVYGVQAQAVSDSSFIPPAKLPAIQAAAQQACDMNDGVKDNIIENPARCHFDTSVLLCKGPDSDSCLTADQLTALNKLYGGSHFANGRLIYPGYPPGGEAAKNNWEVWVTGPAPLHSSMYAYGTQFFKNMVYDNPTWDFHNFQVDRDVKVADQKLASTLNATDPNLHPFIAHGGKLILYHGWDDGAIAAPNTINYFEAVRNILGAAQTNQSVRLFMVPGMDHCFDGNGASSFGQFGSGGGDPDHDIDAALVHWVENGRVPDRIIATKPGTSWTHPLCAYPATAHYSGTGDIASASSYTCAAEAAAQSNH